MLGKIHIYLSLLKYEDIKFLDKKNNNQYINFINNEKVLQYHCFEELIKVE